MVVLRVGGVGIIGVARGVEILSVVCAVFRGQWGEVYVGPGGWGMCWSGCSLSMWDGILFAGRGSSLSF